MSGRYGNRMGRVAPVAAVVLLAAIGLTGCGAAGEDADDGTGSTAAKESQGAAGYAQGTYLAGSMSDYIDQVMGWSKTDDQTKSVLRQVKADGEMSASTYEAAWSQYRTCMIDRGYKPFELTKYPNGIYTMPRHQVGTEVQENKYMEDYVACYMPITPITSVYEKQQANPSLYANMSEAIVDCLRREEVVPMGFTASDYESEKAAYVDTRKAGTFDPMDPKVRSCEIANGRSSTYQDDPAVQLW